MSDRSTRPYRSVAQVMAMVCAAETIGGAVTTAVVPRLGHYVPATTAHAMIRVRLVPYAPRQQPVATDVPRFTKLRKLAGEP